MAARHGIKIDAAPTSLDAVATAPDLVVTVCDRAHEETTAYFGGILRLHWSIDDPVEAVGVLVHELAHAATDGDGHQGRFPTLVKSLKLEGKPSATTVGDAFRAEFGALIDSLGQYPHARLNVNDKKKQPTRLLKAWCSSCGYTVRVTGKWAAIGLPICPTCNEQFRT